MWPWVEVKALDLLFERAVVLLVWTALVGIGTVLLFLGSEKEE